MLEKIVLTDLRKVGTGWLPPLPDERDYTEEHPKLRDALKKLGIIPELKLPGKVDLRKWCSTEVPEQGELGACTAHAAVAIVEYYQKRAFGKSFEGSRLFVYKNARNLQGVTGDAGSFIRDTMGSLALCGVPQEKYWPYTDKEPDFDNDPSAFVYAVADNYEALQYFCHDPVQAGIKPANVLQSVKKYLAVGIPSMFGFYGYNSFEQTDTKGGIPTPGTEEETSWGHAVAAFGYDNEIKITNTKYNLVTTGAILFRNSWGNDWGDNGYGWLPYQYILEKRASDFWSLLNMDWIGTDQFGI